LKALRLIVVASGSATDPSLRRHRAGHRYTRPSLTAPPPRSPRHRPAAPPALWLKALRLIVVASGSAVDPSLRRHRAGNRYTRPSLMGTAIALAASSVGGAAIAVVEGASLGRRRWLAARSVSALAAVRAGVATRG
jgi:hypothetical protein